MSGFIGSSTGLNFAGGLTGFLDLLQTASFRGIPFKVETIETTKGRKIALHEMPFRDGGRAEDLGRKSRVYTMSGYIIGDLAPAMQLALDNAAENPGPGLLIHPTIGAVQATCLSCATSVSKSEGRVIRVRWAFMEYEPQSLTFALIATAIQVLTSASAAIAGIGASLGSSAGPAAATGSAALSEGVAVTAAFSASSTASASDPGALVTMAAGLRPADATSSYGRYGAGATSTALPAGTTIATLQAQLANQRTATAAASSAAVVAAGQLSASTGGAVSAALSALTEAARAGMSDPSAQVRNMLRLAGFSYPDTYGGAGIGGDIAIVRDAMASAARRIALASLASACAAYQPSSYDDAANLRETVGDAFDAEILASADAGDDAAYNALRAMRVAVVNDLTTRGASLPSVVTVTTGMPLPSLVVAYRLYGDATRAEEIANASGAANPAFLPISFKALAA